MAQALIFDCEALAALAFAPSVQSRLGARLNDRSIEVVDLTRAMAKRAGNSLGRARLGSAHAVDASVVATAIGLSSAVIATHDPDDLRRLATAHPSVRIFAI